MENKKIEKIKRFDDKLMQDILDLETQRKAYLITLNQENKLELKDKDKEFLEKKQELMKANTEYLWSLKNDFLDDNFKKQIEKLELYYKIKKGEVTPEDFIKLKTITKTKPETEIKN